MAVQGTQITMTTDGAATAIAGVSAHGNLQVTVRNRGTGTVYLGGVTVTSGGYQLSSADSPLDVDLYQGDALYGCSTGTAPIVDVLRTKETT